MRVGFINLNFRNGYIVFFIQVAFYCTLICTGFLLATVLQSEQNVSTYNQIQISGKQETIRPATGKDNTYQFKARILCWIVTAPKFLKKRALHVKNTWGKRCDKTLFFSSVNNSDFPVIGLNTSEGREHLTAKSMLAFRYIHKHYFNEYDWFMKADDNTYVIVENLKYFLSTKNSEEPVYFGHHFQSVIEGGYTSGGAGYVLSREALRRLVLKGDDDVTCRQDGGAEDVEMGRCLHNLGVYIGYSYDDDGRSLFHCFQPLHHLTGHYPSWYEKYDAAGARKGKQYMGRDAISFHYINPEQMYLFDYLLYHVRVRGNHDDED